MLPRSLRLLFTFLGASLFVHGAERPAPVDLVIYGGTPGGIVTAVRAAREGLRVVLVHHHAHVGGMLSNGLGVFDTMFDGKRAPLYDDVYARIRSPYNDPARRGIVRERGCEPHVAEQTFEALIAAEGRNLSVIREHYPLSAEKSDRIVQRVTFKRMDGTVTTTLAANAFVDASYEGDLAHVIGVEMTIGREGRSQYGEPHAGRVFTKLRPVGHPKAFPDGTNVHVFSLMANELLPGSTGEADHAIQAYNFRVFLTRDPAQRMPVAKPARYERDVYLDLKDRWGMGRFTDVKRSWNAPLLVGGNFEYPAGDWPKRREIAARHKDLALGLLWFLQNDPEVSEATRAIAREWGLPEDEFRDNGGFPWEMYIREARRLVGRHVFTEHDGILAPGLKRAPTYEDSIAITEWPLDSHSCHSDTVPGSDHEGKVLLPEETRPGQIPYRSLLPKEVDNLLVTGCMSSSHIGWGTVRLEPVLMHVGESAAYAVALAKRTNVSPAAVPVSQLQRTLVERGVMLTFFNEFDAANFTPAERAAQYFGTRGFFASYNARLDDPLSAAVARLWAKPVADPMAMTRAVHAADSSDAKSAKVTTMTAREFAALVGREWINAPSGPLTRGDACAWLFAQL